MTVLPGQKLTIGQLFVSFAAGLMFFLLPNDARAYFESPARESMIFMVSILITTGLLFVVRRYEAVGAAMLTAMVLSVANFVLVEANKAFTTENYWPSISRYQLISWIILCSVPFVTTIFVRLFSFGRWNTSQKRRGFCRFLSLALRACLLIYTLVFLLKILIPERISFETPRTMELIPFKHIYNCISGAFEDGWIYIIKYSLILLPVGFCLAVALKRIRWWQILAVGISIGLMAEIIQLSLNTGLTCTDDLILYTVGLFIGSGLKYTIDAFRAFLSMGEEKNILYISEE